MVQRARRLGDREGGPRRWGSGQPADGELGRERAPEVGDYQIRAGKPSTVNPRANRRAGTVSGASSSLGAIPGGSVVRAQLRPPSL